MKKKKKDAEEKKEDNEEIKEEDSETKEETEEIIEEDVEEPKEEPAEAEAVATEEAKEETGEERKDSFGRILYSVKCSDCGKETEVPFKPSGDRPVYCRECFQKHRPTRRNF